MIESVMKNLGVICIVFSVLLLSPVSVEAKGTTKATKNNCWLISSGEAGKKASEKTGGKVVSIKLTGKGKKSKYRVRLLVGENRIKNITVNACK